MFNDDYGLTQAVLDGRKTMTRRIIKCPRTQLANELNCSSDTIRAILDYFNRLNLISATNYTIGGDVIISLNVEASDMALRGGFVAQEELIKKNFEKLLLELDSLKSKFPKNIETITSIIGNISNALQLTRWFG